MNHYCFEQMDGCLYKTEINFNLVRFDRWLDWRIKVARLVNEGG
jgi:hypothetical protein